MIGFETFYAASSSQLRSRLEYAVAVLHFSFIRDGYKCVGIGEDALSGAALNSARRSELLPRDWQSKSPQFSFQYVKDGSREVVMVKMIAVGNNNAELCVTTWKGENPQNTASITLPLSDVASEEWSQDIDYSGINLEKVESVVNTVKKNVLDKLFPVAIQTGPAPNFNDPFASSNQPHVPDPWGIPGQVNPVRPFPGPQNPFQIGSRDLDPFHGTGGNIFPGPGQMIDPSRGNPIYFPTSPDDINPFATGRGSGRGRGRGMPGFTPDPDHMRPWPRNNGGGGGGGFI